MKDVNLLEGHMIGDHLALLMDEANLGGIIEKMMLILIGELDPQPDLLEQLLDDPHTEMIMDIMRLDILRACLHAGLHNLRIVTVIG